MVIFVLMALCLLISCSNPSSSQAAKVLKKSEVSRPSAIVPNSFELVCVDYYNRQGAFDSAVVLQGNDTIRYDTINNCYKNFTYCDTIMGLKSCGKNSTYRDRTIRKFSPDSIIEQYSIQLYDIDTVQDKILTIHGIQFYAYELYDPLPVLNKSLLIVPGKWILLEKNAGYFESGHKTTETFEKYKLDSLLTSTCRAYEYDNNGNVNLVRIIAGTTETIAFKLVNTYWN